MSHSLSGKDQLLRSSDAGLVHDLAPAPNLGIDEALQFLRWRTADGNRAEINHLLLDFWQFQNALQHGMKLVHDRIRCIRRCDNHRPGDCIETGDPCLLTGATIIDQATASKPGTPASAIGGISGEAVGGVVTQSSMPALVAKHDIVHGA